MARHVPPLGVLILAFVCFAEAPHAAAAHSVNTVRGVVASAQGDQTTLPRQQETIAGAWTRADNRARWNAELYNRPMQRF
ncbi:hypothetical protein J2X36_005408 [Methylobacterium sp. BE186]|uniref:hypothetical protein n=1 Tax=Methylobacterium sp. BE186 TaxID=2817715 RepID=UPI0028545EC9|nr:hypothetical protein [Methylobacterium sp. BE186]MDR7040625.1 hypothetical protein [Methylobacterium sp. BE186]